VALLQLLRPQPAVQQLLIFSTGYGERSQSKAKPTSDPADASAEAARASYGVFTSDWGANVSQLQYYVAGGDNARNGDWRSAGSDAPVFALRVAESLATV